RRAPERPAAPAAGPGTGPAGLGARVLRAQRRAGAPRAARPGPALLRPGGARRPPRLRPARRLARPRLRPGRPQPRAQRPGGLVRVSAPGAGAARAGARGGGPALLPGIAPGRGGGPPGRGGAHGAAALAVGAAAAPQGPQRPLAGVVTMPEVSQAKGTAD